MNLLVPLAALLGIEFDSITERVRNAVILNAVMALFGLLGLVFLLVAGFLAVAEQLGGIYAALIFGGGFLLLTLAVYLGSLIGKGRRRHEVAEKRRSSETSAFVTTAAITALPVLLKSPLVLKLGLPAAAIAAFLLTRGGSDTTDE
ncbi:hypothetical protein SAMN05428969_1865 [Devosia sp. YR412]|uniref:hypothetical protein n=1 Tax=Devosia sp. YR412 TaxID=1881030 RepID=UPI0008D677B1|nr:hypothetical protein [Devosia sp. YR412]SEQ08020.1 hypothetical protein SAMN05428969_1865 [Devosia sp. YR412]